MNEFRIKLAINEAKRFIASGNGALSRLELEGNNNFITGNRESGSLRRASMDLTRALADMRKPQ